MILHVMILEKFLPPFIDFVDKHFGRGEHKYVFITSEKYLFGLTPEHNVEFLHTDEDIFVTLLSYMREARKIILHGLWRDKVDQLLVQETEFLRKSYWIMWGGDFYFPEKHSKNRHFVIKNVAYLITSASGDVELVRREYSSTGKHISSASYTSNIFDGNLPSGAGSADCSRILIGNSASTTNNHFEIFKRLDLTGHSGNIKIYCPLSYGCKEYAAEVMQAGSEMFGDSFIGMTEFMSYYEYMRFLDGVDIAIFDHERQQAFGNIIQLVGRGKKVFLNKKSSLYHFFDGIDVVLYDSSKFEINLLPENLRKHNYNIILERFSEKSLSNNLSSWMI